MSVKSVLDKWARNGMLGGSPFETDFTPRRPGPEVIGLVVAWDREMKQLSVEALASLANVSVSTIERIERCEPVGHVALRSVALALGREEGAFVDIRVPLDAQQALESLSDAHSWLDGTVSLPVHPLRTQRQIREIADCVAVLVDDTRLDGEHEHLTANLRELVDLAGFLRACQAGLISGGGTVKMRKFYSDFFDAVRAVERSAYVVALAGTYQAEVGPNSRLAGQRVKAGVIAFFPKRTDPYAIKRRFLRAAKTIEFGWGDSELVGH